MFDFNHLKDISYLTHLKRALYLFGLLMLSALALLVHAFIPFWQQPEKLRMTNVCVIIAKQMLK